MAPTTSGLASSSTGLTRIIRSRTAQAKKAGRESRNRRTDDFSEAAPQQGD